MCFILVGEMFTFVAFWPRRGFVENSVVFCVVFGDLPKNMM